MPDHRSGAAPSLTLIARLVLALPLIGCGTGSTIGTQIQRPGCECERPLMLDEPTRQSPMPELRRWKKEKKVEADSERFEGKERVCRYDNDVVIRVALPKPCPTF